MMESGLVMGMLLGLVMVLCSGRNDGIWFGNGYVSGFSEGFVFEFGLV